MKQLLLDLNAERPQTLGSFVSGNNEELLTRLQSLVTAVRDKRTPEERFIYVWGESGAGKSHLLHALAAATNARYIAPDAESHAFDYSPGIPLYLIDDCNLLTPAAQIDAFNLYNQAKENGASLITAGSTAPVSMQVREDLRTRLGWGLIYQVHGLSDDEKIAALGLAAEARGLSLSSGVLPYLLTHFHRDMRSLSAMLDAMDRYSLETKRPITLPLLRELLQQEDETKA